MSYAKMDADYVRRQREKYYAQDRPQQQQQQVESTAIQARCWSIRRSLIKGAAGQRTDTCAVLDPLRCLPSPFQMHDDADEINIMELEEDAEEPWIPSRAIPCQPTPPPSADFTLSDEALARKLMEEEDLKFAAYLGRTATQEQQNSTLSLILVSSSA